MTTESRHPDIKAFMTFAHEVADESGKIARQHFRARTAIDIKSDGSPVTIADRSIEAFILERVENTFPDHGLFGEETGQTGLDRDYVWVVDPIDGTRAFTTGFPLFGTLVSLMFQGQPIMGMIDAPATYERWIGDGTGPTTFCGSPANTSDIDTLAPARLSATSPELFAGEDADAFRRLSSACGWLRYGGDCYAYGLLASGHLELVCETGLQPYDFMATIPVIEGAGGIITDWQGQPLDLQSSGDVIAAANPELHAQALAVLQSGQAR